jgi:arginase family enzyme
VQVRTLLGDFFDGPRDVRRLLLSAPLTPDQIVYVGTRDLDAPEQAYIDAHGMALLDATPSATLAARVSRAVRHFDAVYIHVDLDVLDPAAFPCTCCPTPAGLALDDLVRAVRAVRDAVPVVAGVGLTECCGDPSEHFATLDAVVAALGGALEKHQ